MLPRGIEKTAVMHLRVLRRHRGQLRKPQRPLAARCRGECEAQLNRALVDTGTALWPILQLLSDVLAKLSRI